MNDSTALMSKAGNAQARRPRHRLIAGLCLTALGLSALVATGPAGATSALPAQATPTGTSVSTSDQLRNAVANIGGVINLAPGVYNLTTQLEIRRNGTQLRAVEPGNTTLAYTGTASTSKSRVLEVWATGVVVDGVTITGGKSPTDDGGGGVEVERGANLTLSRSWVTGNTDSYGAGVFNEGTITIVGSTISANTASVKGGGLLNEGTATVTNSTIEGNTSYWGSAIASFNTINLSHTTVVRNVTTDNSTSLGALQRFNGTFNVRYSVVGDNLGLSGSARRNCAGTVSLRTLNLVSSTAGCSLNDTVITQPILVGSLQANGGPTPTAGLLDASPAIDAVNVTAGACASTLATDQRGVARPAGPKCDLGAFEKATLELVDPTLRVDTAKYRAKGLPAGTVEVGATSVPSGLIAGEFAADATTDEDGTINSARLRSIRLRSIRLRSIELQDLRLRSIDVQDARLRSIELKANRLRSIALETIRLRSIDLTDTRLRSIDLDSTGLQAIPLSEIPLIAVAGGWEAFLATTPFAGVPLQSLTLADLGTVVPASFTLASIDLDSTRLRSIRLRSILLEGTRLRSIPLSDQLVAPSPANDKAWCDALLGATNCTGNLPSQVGNVELWEAQLAGADVDQESVLSVPLSGLTSTRLRSIDPSATDIEDARLRSIRLRSIFLENTALSAIRLRSIAQRAIPAANGLPAITIGSIIDCSKNPSACTDTAANTLTLGDAVRGCLPEGVPAESGAPDPATCLLRQDADLGLLLDLLGVRVAGVSLLDELTLADILLAFTPPEDIPWESVNLEAAGLQNIATPPQPTFDYVVGVEVRQGPATVTVDLTLPAGFALAEGSVPEAATFCVAATTCTTDVAPADGTTSFTIPNVASGRYELRVPVRAGSTIGSPDEFPASSTVTATGPNGAITKASNTIGVTVVQANSNAPKAPSLRDGQLELGYIGGSGELDVYSFVAPAGTTGASARILLSNVPKDVDYDLAVYGPRPSSLRGAPLPERPAIGDDQFDLDPGDDVLATDIVDDIALDITKIAPTVGLLLPPETTGYGLRDISSRRSNVDEEVTLPALVSGKTYVVVVSGYFSDVSPEPYGLRVRLDRRTAIPACAATTYPATSTPPALAASNASLAITPSTNTLYVTHAARLGYEAGRTGSAKTFNDVATAIAATDGVNGVDAGLLLLDGLPQWNTYNANSCDPEVRNVLAKAIGAAIDTANGPTGANGKIENIVIVGGDGVVPMAAVPDLAEYSNESTFALSVLDGAGRTTPTAGALASGYLLSDDPYATDAGISILGGDHELYVPDRNVGRLVETADEIIAQLTNFVTYGGKLDPRTFDAAVTGYDFLDDGARAVIDELDGRYAVDPLLGDLWDREDYLDLFRSGTDYRVFSPNAHYDFEALLPALPDTNGIYDDDDLVTTADLTTGVVGAAKVPVRALGFTVGCHAGLSVSDVQVGPTLDWAQLYSRNNTQWIAHTTYGYGDTEIVAYSERLAELFAGNVAAMTATANPTMSLGAAVTDAKQRYLASTLVISPYDEKILQSWTYYGLPMYTIGTPPAPNLASQSLVEDSSETIIDETIVDETIVDETTTDETTTDETIVDQTIVDETSSAQGFRSSALLAQTPSGPATFGPPAGNGRVPVAIDVRTQLAKPTFPTPPATGPSYYSVNGSIVSVQDRPVQPLVDVAIPGATTNRYGGFLITGLVSRDLPNTYTPFVSRPIVDNSTDESRFLAGDVAFPANLQQVTNIGDGQRLLVAAGQWQNGQRLFDRISGELIPRSGNDTEAPRFLDVTGTNINDVGASGRGIRFDVTTEPDATRVVILFREEGTANWRTLELTGSNGAWFGVAALVRTAANTKAEFFAQSVDAAGNVGITSNKIENFLSVDDTGAPTDSITAIIEPGGNEEDGRFFGDGGTFTIEPSDSTDAPATFSIDSGTPLPVPANGLTIDVLPAGSESSYSENGGLGVLGLEPGDYVITARYGDGPATNRFFIVDGDAPDVTYSRDDLSAWTTPAKSGLDVSASDPAGVKSLTATVTGATGTVLQTVTGSDDDGDGVFTAKIDPIIVDVGSSAQPTLTVVAEDAVGNKRTLVSTLFVDNKAPVVSISPKSTLWSNEPVVITVTASDTDAGLASVCLARNGGGCIPITLTNGVYTERIITEGLTSLSVTAKDALGNESEPDSAEVRVDTVDPTATITPDGETWRTGTVTAVIDAADPGGTAASGIDSVCLQNGNACTPLTADADGLYRTEVTVSADSDGTPSITVTVTDVARNTNDIGPVTFRIDNKAPVLTLVTDQVGEWTNKAVKVTATASDGTGSGIAELCLDQACSPTNPKTATIDTSDGTVLDRPVSASAIDRVGKSTTDTLTVKIDKSKPVVTIAKSPDTPWTNGPVTVTVTAEDAGSGLDAVCLDSDDGNGCVAIDLVDGEYQTTFTTDGARDVTVNATDKAGNQAVSKSTTVGIDKVKPVVTITKSPNTTWANGAVTVTIAATDDRSGIATVCLSTNGGTCQGITLDAAGEYEFTASSDGTTTYEVGATDRAGNIADSTSSTSTTVSIDTVKPTATLSVSADSNNDGIYRFDEPSTATFSCADTGSGVAGCALFDGNVQVATTSPYTINTAVTGTKTLTVRATDVAGNTFTSPAKTITVAFRTCVLTSSRQATFLPTYTLRLTLCDQNGVNRSASNISLTALAIDGTRDPIFNFSGLPLNYRFRYVSSGRYYEYTFFTGGLARGAHTLSFTTQPVPSRNIGTVELNKLATNIAPFTLR
jgi:uncharacterized protein YjbI with pentapeptide repeats